MSSAFSAPKFSLVQLENTDLKMCLLSCPGIRFASGKPTSNTAILEEDVQRLAKFDVKLVVSCISEPELLLGTPAYAEAFQRAGIEWHLVPIPDMSPPSVANDVTLAATFQSAKSVLADDGSTIAFHCLAGLGRTGTVAARFAMTYGLSAHDAIQFIRTHHDRKAIETKEQEAYLLDH